MHRYMFNNGNKENPRIFANFLSSKGNYQSAEHGSVKEVKDLENKIKSKMLSI